MLVCRGTPEDYPDAPLSSDALLLVEVSDTTLRYDRGTKADMYAADGIPDYWLRQPAPAHPGSAPPARKRGLPQPGSLPRERQRCPTRRAPTHPCAWLTCCRSREKMTKQTDPSKEPNLRKKIIAGNWKMNKTVAEALALVDDLAPRVADART